MDYPALWHNNKWTPLSQLQHTLDQWRENGDRIVSTNGCFDLIHSGHTAYLSEAKSLGDRLIVGLNSDRSVSEIKGTGKPILSENDRAAVLSELQSVDAVVVFDDLLPNHFLEIVKPQIHCKAGDYTAESLPETEIVQQFGGEIRILPIVDGISTSRIIERIISGTSPYSPSDSAELSNGEERDVPQQILQYLLNSSNLFRQSAYRLKGVIEESLKLMIETLERGNRILLCGNGGSAADAQHIAAEFVGRFKLDRQALPALALTTDTSILTAIGNDYGFDQVFSRQVSAHGTKGDLLIAISTSGRSENVLKAVDEANNQEMFSIGFTGAHPTELSKRVNVCVSVPSTDTPLIQQIHIGILHLLCDLCEQKLAGSSETSRS